jgi:hypothetical protein
MIAIYYLVQAQFSFAKLGTLSNSFQLAMVTAATNQWIQ